MGQKKKRFRIIIFILLFLIYFLLAARPVPREVVLAPKWISSFGGSEFAGHTDLSSGISKGQIQETSKDGFGIIPFTLGQRFGYIDSSGHFSVNRPVKDNIYLSQNMWTEYEAESASIEIKNINQETIIKINNARGYPILLDNRVFIFGSEQNSLSEIDKNGNILWTYEFGAPLTCIDARAGLLLTGSLDGIIEIFNSTGERIFHFMPGGSRFEVILGCALSSDGSRIGIISGVDQQRFLLLERFVTAQGVSSVDYKVVYHEFLDTGFRRPVRISFIDEDRRVIFERAGGISCYNIRARRALFIPLDGEIRAVDNSGEQGFLFLITSSHDFNVNNNKLIGIRFPQDRFLNFSSASGTANKNAIFLEAGFKSDDVFLYRTHAFGMQNFGSQTASSQAVSPSMLVVGGGTALIAFDLEEK